MEKNSDKIRIGELEEELGQKNTYIATLETQLAAANEAVRVWGEYYNADCAMQCTDHDTSSEQLRAIKTAYTKARNAVFNNPLARASVEKAGQNNEQ